MGRYFEEFVCWREDLTEKRTITEADIMDVCAAFG